jgi:hypothetical protein
MLSGENHLLLGIVDRDEGWMTIEGGRPDRSGVARLEFTVEPAENMELRPGVQQRGEILVALQDPHDAIGSRTDPAILVQDLYKGILQRKPEEGIVRARAKDIADHGLAGLKRQAHEIAESPESIQKLRPDGDVSDRLEALYLHLLGVEPEEIPTAEGRVYTTLLKRKEIAEVVERMIDSDRYHFRHGFYEEP